MTTKLSTVALAAMLTLWLQTGVPAAEEPSDLADLFSITGEDSILEEEHCGIVNGMLTTGIQFKDLVGIAGLWAPPFVSSDFHLTATVLGQRVPTQRYVWRPFQVERTGAVLGIGVKSLTTLVPRRRAGLLTLTLENTTAAPRNVPVAITVGGTLDRVAFWEFARPVSKTAAKPAADSAGLVLGQGDLAIVLRGAKGGFHWEAPAACGRVSVDLAPGARATLHVALAVGAKPEALAACEAIAADPEKAAAAAQAAHARQVTELFEKLPRLRSRSPALVRFYNRSLVHLLMNRWDVPEFLLHPYYSTGSVKGGCVCSYLWDFGEAWEVLPLYDPAAVREHVKQFLKIDMTTHFAFDPVRGAAFGPWYPVNQEKIVGLIYYYVQNTGDNAFLREVVDGRTILDHAMAHATFGDDLSKPVALIDYGPSNSHLELRRGYPYNHTMPDLNGRRYASYLLGASLADLAGKPAPQLRGRAEALKTLLKQTLWDPQTRWFDFLDGKGRKDTRYTVQIFKLLGSSVLDAEEESGLLGHFNQREFYSQFGLHSMSKTDVAYDQIDIDNGGGGSYVGFPPQIAERLYKAGHPVVAEEILKRILWWGQRMPYWGDSLVANSVDYRKDTPLQCSIAGVSVAQCIIFGMFGVSPELGGDILINPHPPALAPEIELTGLRVRGKVLDIAVQGAEYQVRIAGEQIRVPVGKAVRLRGSRLVRAD